eukprot:14050374-Ditylum_brightwellii.AAC.1
MGTCTYDAMDKLKSKLRKIKVSKYLGENVQKMNVDIKAQCNILDNAEAKVTYGTIFTETTTKYEELMESTDWTPHVHEKEQSADPDLPKTYETVI